VYGFLGNKRIPLPGCAYTAIRKKFQGGTDESFTGFDLDEEEKFSPNCRGLLCDGTHNELQAE